MPDPARHHPGIFLQKPSCLPPPFAWLALSQQRADPASPTASHYYNPPKPPTAHARPVCFRRSVLLLSRYRCCLGWYRYLESHARYIERDRTRRARHHINNDALRLGAKPAIHHHQTFVNRRTYR